MKLRKFCQKNISLPVWILFGIAILCIPIKIAAVLSEPFADFFNRYVSGIFRAVFAHVTSILPFSLAETLILISIPAAILYLVYSFTVSAAKGKLPKQILRLVAIIAFLFSTFMLNFGTGYDTTPLEEKMDLEVGAPTTDNLYLASAYTLIHIRNLTGNISYQKSGLSKLPYTFDEMVDKLNDAYDTLYGQYDFLSPLHTRVKQLAMSKPLTYTHLSGFYTCFTGEANVNINYPDFIIAFTTAHEMAHQRGIAPEDEANFIAYLACVASDDPHLQYAGHANMLEYLASAVYDADPEGYQNRLLPFYPKELRGEYKAYSTMFKPYADNVASNVSNAVNDTYLKVQGQTEGTKSYGLVTDLAVAYIINLEEVPN